MPLVTIEGVFMGADVKTSTFEGNTKSAILVDIYQPNSTDSEKTVQVKADDLGLMNTFAKDYSMGSPFSCVATVNAYKNKAYYKLQAINE